MNRCKLIMALTAVALIACVANATARETTFTASKVTTFTVSKVVDAKGRVVGTILDRGGSAALVGLNGNGFNHSLFLLPVGAGGFQNSQGHYFWTSIDCSGSPLVLKPFNSSMYSAANQNDLNVNDNILYFTSGPLTSTTVNSDSDGSTPADAALSCFDPSFPQTLDVGPVSTFDLTTLGFKTPFKLK